MSTYSVAEAKSNLSSLIEEALEGNEVVITRRGKPVVELRPTTPAMVRPEKATHEWLRARRDARPSVAITSIELLRELYEDE